MFWKGVFHGCLFYDGKQTIYLHPDTALAMYYIGLEALFLELVLWTWAFAISRIPELLLSAT
jgi:hypothetical protein